MKHPEGPPGAESNLERENGEYDPVEVLREREIGPEVFGVDAEGRTTIEDRDFAYITDYLREHSKPGSVLNLGGGFMHAHRMLSVIDHITHATSIDISEKNNEVVAEFLEGAGGVGAPEWIDASDIAVLRTYAEALAQQPRYGVEQSPDELLRMLHEKSRQGDESDVITADVIAEMADIGSGALLENRTYDNILFLWSIFTRNREETKRLLENVKQRLNEGGRLIVMDVWEYSGVEEDGDAMHAEDERVAKLYPKPWIWNEQEFTDILKEVGFSKIRTEEKRVESSEDEEEAIGGYICFVIEE